MAGCIIPSQAMGYRRDCRNGGRHGKGNVSKMRLRKESEKKTRERSLALEGGRR
jgi:hypothetical protein